MELNIDNRTGEVTLNDYKIDSSCTPGDLPEFFKLGNEMEVLVLKEKVPCLFASTNFSSNNISTKIDLRFEKGVLVSIFVELTDKNRKYVSSAEWYESAGERELTHLDWLKNRMGDSQEKYTVYDWGKAGVA